MRLSTARATPLAWLLTVALPWIAAGPALAHRPYFTQAQPIVLPDGRRGEMRIIAGDGIVIADPVRIVILDENSRLIARGPRVRWLSLVCDASRRCHGYDHGSDEVIEPDPTSFGKDGPVVPPADDRDDLWQIEDGEAAWGVSVRPATWGERFSAERGAILATRPWTPAFYAVLGLLAGLCFVGFHAPGRSGPQFLLWLGGLALRVTLCAAVTIILLVAIVMGDTVPSIVYGSVLAGLLLAWRLGPKIGRRFRSALAAR